VKVPGASTADLSRALARAEKAVALTPTQPGRINTLAMAQYRTALQLAPNDPELERAIAELSETVTRSANERQSVRARSLLASLEQWLLLRAPATDLAA
jgi:hypothetical protein